MLTFFLLDGLDIAVGDAVPVAPHTQLEQTQFHRQIRLSVSLQRQIVIPLGHVEILLNCHAVLM